MSSNLEMDNKESMCGQAESYAIGATTPSERTAFERHLKNCLACKSELEAAANTLANAIPLSAVDTEARSRFISKLREVNASSSSSEVVFSFPGVLAKRASIMQWQPAGLEGVWVKTLFDDTARKYRTTLVRLESGAHYPSHKHAEVEEAYVLEGDLHFDAGTLFAGDYCRAESGSIHSSSYTENGCTLLITTSTADELLPAH